jgi:hypothetical protein
MNNYWKNIWHIKWLILIIIKIITRIRLSITNVILSLINLNKKNLFKLILKFMDNIKKIKYKWIILLFGLKLLWVYLYNNKLKN